MKLHTRFFWIALIVFSFAAYACQNESQQNKVTDEVEKVYTESQGDEAQTIAYLHIEGMSCEQACGSAITRAVSGVAGVNSTDLEFDKEKTVDVIKVNYDASSANEDDLIKAVTDIHKGLYQVKKIEVVSIVKAEDDVSDQETEDDASVTIREFSLPNISDIIENLIK
ncbi:MAG: heavy-metal-associated domain-containing protein [Flavobacteriales bacterium]|nr:heavy-metal-associated domain-containing protein [Flavobacteriales bacterium]